MKGCVRKSCFTLLEILVVLILLSLGIALTGVKIKEAYQEQRFLSEAQMVVNHLSMAQDLMMIMNADVTLRISSEKNRSGQSFKDSDGLRVWLEVEKPLGKHWARLIERELTLKAIGSVEFEGELLRDLPLLFSFGRMSQGKLVLREGEARNQSERKREIDLLGYPSRIGSKKDEETEEKAARSERLYPVEVYKKHYEDKQKKNT